MTSWTINALKSRIESNGWKVVTLFGLKLERVISALACKWKPSLLIVDMPLLTDLDEDVFILEVSGSLSKCIRSLSSICSDVKCIFYTALQQYTSMQFHFPPIVRRFELRAKRAAISRLLLSEFKVLSTIAFAYGVERLIIVSPVKCTNIMGKWLLLPYFPDVVAKISDAIFWVRKEKLCQLKPELLSFTREGACHPDLSEKLAFEILRNWPVAYS